MQKNLFLVIILFCLFSTTGCNEKPKLQVSKVEATDLEVKKSTNQDKDNQLLTEEEVLDIAEFIPKGWAILKQHDQLAIAEGDLNKDGLKDKAFIIEQVDASKVDSPRNLIIIFNDEDKKYTQSIKAEKAILLECEGGTFGDPFQSIEVDRGSVLLRFCGGSSRWHKYFRFRYQDNGWYLIGYTEGSYEAIGDAMVCLQDDYNLITGDYIGNKLVDGKIKTVKENIGKRKLLNLEDFVVNEYQVEGY